MTDFLVESGSNTSLSLLLRIKDGKDNEEAWQEFVRRYGTRIYEWCLNRKLSAHDAEDVAQNILLKLAKSLKRFEYDNQGTFRGWLRRVTENALIDFFKDQNKNRVGAVEGHSLLEFAESKQDLIERLDSAFDLEILERAIEAVRRRVSDYRFSAWELTTRKGLSGAEAAKQLDVRVSVIYSAKKQVQKFIQEEIRKLESRQVS